MLEFLLPRHCYSCSAPCTTTLCPACRSSIDVQRYAVRSSLQVFSASDYHTPLGRALGRAKATNNRRLIHSIATATATEVGPFLRGAEALISVPSPWLRTLRRGFVPASVFTRAWSRHSGVPMSGCLSVKGGARQSTLKRSQRQHNLAGRLRLNRAPPNSAVLIDDVCTTGATASACAQLLTRSGCSKVWVVTAFAATHDETSRLKTFDDD